ncbi:hypothetical protein PInf_018194 [Phytophthora infestans]|nr:hypothetical protein PInf_018194 [Phytophthora infestans]
MQVAGSSYTTSGSDGPGHSSTGDDVAGSAGSDATQQTSYSSTSSSGATQVSAPSSSAGGNIKQVAGSSSTTSGSDGPGHSSTSDDVAGNAGSDATQQTSYSSTSSSGATQVPGPSSSAGGDVEQVAGSISTTSGSNGPGHNLKDDDVAGSDATQQIDYSSKSGSDATQQTDSSLATGSAEGSAATPAATPSPAGSGADQVTTSSSTAGSNVTQGPSSGSSYTPTSSGTSGSGANTASQSNGDSTTQGTATPAQGSLDEDTTSPGSDNIQNDNGTPIKGDTPAVSSSNSKGTSSGVDADSSASSSPSGTPGQNDFKPAGSGSRTLQVDVGTTEHGEDDDDADNDDDISQYDASEASTPDDSPIQQTTMSESSDDSPTQQTTMSESSDGSNSAQQTSTSASESSDSSATNQESASASSAIDSSSSSSNTSTTASGSTESSESASASSSASASASAASASSFKKVTRLGVRVQGDMPEWNEKHKRFVSSYYETFDEKYRAVLDTVNMASVEGALKYVQAECINASVITKCKRKNNIKYVVFYQTTTVQPTAAMEYYVNATDERNYAVESCPFLPMDGGRCNPTDDGSFPDVCNQFIGADGQPDLGFCVGGTLQDNEAIAPYPHNYWFSFPNSCPQKAWDDKTASCRKKYAGGMCPVGVEPDGVTCTFTYEILGYILLDDVVGITSIINPKTGKKYADYKEFCKAGGVEFSVSIVTGVVSLLTGILSSVVDLVEGLDFWADPGDSAANSERVEKLVSAYDALIASNPATSDGGVMRALPRESELAALNPSCYENSPLCAESEFGCKRSYLSQICQLCTSDESGCEKA